MPSQAEIALQTLGPQAAPAPSTFASAAGTTPANPGIDIRFGPDPGTPIAPEDRPGHYPSDSATGAQPVQQSQAQAALLAAISPEAAGATANAQLPGQPLPAGYGVLKGLNDVTTAGGQMLVHALPDSAVNAVNSATQYVNDLPGIGPVTQALGMVPSTAQQFDQSATQGEQQYQADRIASAPQTMSGLVLGQAPDPGIDWGRIGGNFLGTMPAAVAKAPMALARVPALAKMLMSGATFGAISQPVTSGDYATEKGKAILASALTAGGTGLALKGAAAVIAPKVSDSVRALLNSGVTPTLGQTLGGSASRIEQAATSIPVLGDFIKNAQRRGVQQMNTAAFNRALNPVGESLPAGMEGREALGHVIDTLGDRYDKIVSKIGSVKPDETFLSNVANLQGLTGNMAKPQAEQFGRILDNEVLGRIDQHGRMTGEGLKAAESSLGKMAKGYRGSQDYDARQLGLAISQTQAELREMLARVDPSSAPALQGINKGYANLMPVQRAAAYVGADGGVFSPAQLQQAVKANDPSLNNRAFARGDALMQDLSDPAKSVLGSKLPDSGTPYRHGVQALAMALLGHGMLPEGASHYAIPLGAGVASAALPYTEAGQKIVSALLTKRPASAARLAAALQGAAPYAALAAPALATGSK